jgi:hypothetical protein
VNPDVASIGSAAWARYVIDGDVAYEIDSREADRLVAVRDHPARLQCPEQDARRPRLDLRHDGLPAQSLARRLGLLNLTKATPLADSDEMKACRAAYRGPAERTEAPIRPPRRLLLLVPLLVREGDEPMGRGLDQTVDGREGRVRDERDGGPGLRRGPEAPLRHGTCGLPEAPGPQDGQRLLHSAPWPGSPRTASTRSTRATFPRSRPRTAWGARWSTNWRPIGTPTATRPRRQTDAALRWDPR